MAIHARLDVAGCSRGCALIAFALLLMLLPQHGLSQGVTFPADRAREVKQLFDAGRWQDIVDAVPQSSKEPAELELDRGLALARLQKWSAAKAALEAGHQGYPRDPRFLVELAGIAYIEKHYSSAKKDLRQALALDPRDAYANNLLASIYFLEGNLDAALKYWNRAGKPKLTDLIYDPAPKLDPLILDRAFRFSPGMVWKRDEYLTTQTELQSLNLFPSTFYELAAQPDGSFKLIWHDGQQTGLTGMNLQSALTLLRGLPYQEVYPEVYDIDRKGLNWLSMIRWDDEKRRLSSEVASPWAENPKRRLRMYFDGRNENWNIANRLIPGVAAPAGFNMRRAVMGAEVRAIESWRWQWNVGAEYSYRDFRTLQGIPGQAGPFFENGSGLTVRSGVQRSLIRFPERRFNLNAAAMGETGRFYGNGLGVYGRVQGSLAASWLPKATGDDYGVTTMLRAGGTFGQVPFDELYMLGFDRDNDLWMRGHFALRNGQKGNAPMGRNFILSNSDFEKVVYHGPFFEVKVGPFLDTGDIYDPSQFFGSRKWLTDTGLQATVKVLGNFAVVLGYGKDLRSGNNTFYSTVLR